MVGSLSDFWWLEQNQLDNFTYLELGHNEPVDDLTCPTIQAQKCQITKIDEFRSKYHNINIHRSFMLWDASVDGQGIFGPFLVDIDNDNDLNASHMIVKQLLNYLINNIGLTAKDLRIFFTGHKGFNIEIRPKSLKIYGSVPEQIKLSSKILDSIIDNLRQKNVVQDSTINAVDDNGTIIDRLYGDRFYYKLKHPFVRLHDSINKWVSSDKRFVSRKKIELSSQELLQKSIREILSENEALT